MALDNTSYEITSTFQVVENNDKKLLAIISEIQDYLKYFDKKWPFLVFSRFYREKCIKSWASVSTHLEKFLREPQTRYTLLMTVLEQEMMKFPQDSLYSLKLKALYELIAMGPSFSLTQSHHQKPNQTSH